MKRAVAERVDAVIEALSDCAPGTRYLNFTDRGVGCETMFAPDVLRRLCDVKAAYDPDDLFQANHPIAPTA